MAIIRELVYEQRVIRQLDGRIASRINKRLDRLKGESPWGVSYRWGTSRRRLFVVTGPLEWEAVFNSRTVKIYAQGPVLLMPFLAPVKKKTVAVLKEEIELLSR